MLYGLVKTGASPSSTLDSIFVEPGNRADRRRLRSRRYRSARRHFEDGNRRAVKRAFIAAGLYTRGNVPTLRAAAESCAVAVNYVRAAIVIRAVRDPSLEQAVIRGEVQLFAAAEAMKPLADLMTAATFADSHVKVAFTKAVGPAIVWDDFIVPALGAVGADMGPAQHGPQS